ncbi:MAG: sulfatase-like hydrolase/transferase [Verrucomicrobia bacterium]|nr:sulfatase-like hydrolase/transferase [Verrucomicrobiota bacterium]
MRAAGTARPDADGLAHRFSPPAEELVAGETTFHDDTGQARNEVAVVERASLGTPQSADANRVDRPPATPAAPSRPNLVFILADDLGYRDLGCYGVKDIRTPVLDRLAKEGVRFTQFYANGPECSPTRAALLTGRYQQRVGGLECAIGSGNIGRYDDAIRLRATHDLGLPASEPTLGRLLKDAGYATALFGKWHLGYEDKFTPGAHGFDQALYCVGGGMDYFHHLEPTPQGPQHVLFWNGRPEKRDAYFTDLIADEAERFIAAHRDRPFFLYLPFTAPHSPFQGPDERQPHPLPDDSPRWPQGKAPPEVYAAMIERMDTAVGRVLAALDQEDLAKRTLVIFTSDNGGTASARPTGLRGIKGSTYEGGVRVPCIVRWPGTLPAGIVTQQVAVTFDLTASLARAGGVKLPPGRTFDGQDVLALIADQLPETSRTLFWRQRRGENTWKAARDGALKYVARFEGQRPPVEGLFDLDADAGEQHDLLASRPEEARRLRGLLAAWEKAVAPVR